MTKYALWFGRLVWLGIVLNFAFGLLGLFAPDTLTQLFGLERATPRVWARDAGLFLIFVSLFYVPAASDPWRYRFNAYLLVIARFGYVAFWFIGVAVGEFGRPYLMFGVADLIIAVPQAILLYLTFKHSPDGPVRA